MTGIETVGILTTILGLLGEFKRERKDCQEADHQAFLEWLANHRHDQVINAIVSNAALQTELSTFLRQDTQAIIINLDKISKVLATVASGVHEFKGLAEAALGIESLHPEPVMLLKNLVENQWEEFTLRRYGGGMTLHPDNGDTKPFDIATRHLEEDLEVLTECGLLRRSETRNDKTFSVTRSGKRLCGLKGDG